MSDSQKIKVKSLSDNHGVAFGTSGVRGLVEGLTPELCFAFTKSFLQGVCFEVKEVAIGVDLRPSSPAIAKAVVAAVEAHGAKAIYCGDLPTPALAFYAMQNSIPAVMITGSHIPFDRNGIKFYRPDGEISKSDESIIMSGEVLIPNNLAHLVLADLVDPSLDAIRLFEERYTNLFPAGVLLGKRIGVYEHSSVARDIIKKLLRYFGAEVVSLERKDSFVPIDTEAVSKEDAAKGISWAREFKLDAIVSTDGDGDRPLISDENGKWLRGDVVGVLCADFLKATHVAAPVNVNTVLELSDAKRICIRTKIGSPYVIKGMSQLASDNYLAKVVGYEANGGFLVGSELLIENGKSIKPLPTRDSILPIMIVLAKAALENKRVSDLLADYPPRFTASDRVRNISQECSFELIQMLKDSEPKIAELMESVSEGAERRNVLVMDETDGLRIEFLDKDIVHLRPSGNAPELRCYVESNCPVKAAKQVESVLGKVRALKESGLL
ncbi:phosphomannomutase [Marinomonas dokdonensis]|uniref:phosphomannomutase n=1 Tax=Marinomonas dokdonensis TaxID=328224 RepID=UPI0040558F48